MDNELNNSKISPNDRPRRRSTVKRKPKDYSGSRWAGLILLVISFIISLIFYVRSGAGDFFSSVFGPAKYTIEK